MPSKRHRHTFHAFCWNFGPFGDQTVHVHPCWDDDCERVLIGEGRECEGPKQLHRRVTLTSQTEVGGDQ